MSSTSTSRSRTPERPDAQVTLLTPPGIGATAVVRVSGTGAARLVDEAFRGHGNAVTCRPRNQISHGEIRSGGEYIDEVLVVRTSNPTDHPTPHPEETPGFDICTHGGIRVVERVILAFVRAGAAFVDHQEQNAGIWPASNEIEREILTALTTAGTRRSVSFLLHQRLALPQALRHIAQTARRDRAAAADAVRTLVDRASASHRLVAGFTLAITGPPNAGKSTLANRLAGVVGSLVSDRPGTTLDCVARETAIRGIAASLIDTPGRD
ncbi:MAG: hypothetical protein GY842_05135, partial [bacterium]|nr:hypothetical protein [bacterium]